MNTKNTIRITDDSVDLSVSVFLFREDETYIAYCPSLDISGYDKTEEGAKADLEYMLKSWAKEQLTNGTIREDLEVHGWKVGSTVAREPSVQDLVRKGRPSNSILSLPEFRKTNISTGVLCHEYV